MHASLARRLPEMEAICNRFGVSTLDVFGSAARSDDFDPARSDADFLVEIRPSPDLSPLDQFFGLADALRELLDRPVDIVERGAVRNPYVFADIERGRVRVYASA